MNPCSSNRKASSTEQVAELSALAVRHLQQSLSPHKSGRNVFGEAAREFANQERHKEGLIALQPLAHAFGLAPVLEHLEPGKVSQPMRLGKGFCLVELIEIKISQLDEFTREALLADQLRLWIDSVVDMETTLRWS